MRLIGDIHGQFTDYVSIAVSAPFEKSVQIGDFGYGFFSKYTTEKLNTFQLEYPDAKFIRGNHDHPKLASKSGNFIKDGFFDEDNSIMYVGGAQSYDRAIRTSGINWWPDEELSMAEYYELFDSYIKNKPKIMVTHDAPEMITYKMFLAERGGTIDPSRTGQVFQQMWERHQPEYWFFGHWHITKRYEENGTIFQCIGELDYIDLNL